MTPSIRHAIAVLAVALAVPLAAAQSATPAGLWKTVDLVRMERVVEFLAT